MRKFPSPNPVSLSFVPSFVRSLGAVLLLLFTFGNAPAFGETLSVEMSAKLQASLSGFLAEASADDGSFSYLDRNTARRNHLYPTTKHPIIVPFDGDYYLCMTMRNTEGDKINVDFLLRPKSANSGADGFVVVDVFVDARHVMEQALKHN